MKLEMLENGDILIEKEQEEQEKIKKKRGY